MPIALDKTKDEAGEAGDRLRRTRIALGYKTIRRFAQILDEDESLMRKYEAGEVRVPNRVVHKLYEKEGVDQNWIYGGVKRGLPHDLVLKLNEEEEKET